MLLENSGYSTKMFEFVPTEHTPKNNLLVAIKQAPNSREVNNIEAVEQLMSAFEVSGQRLYHLLQE
jgi:hypothetical protein